MPAGYKGYLTVRFDVKVPENVLLWVSMKSSAGVYWLYSDEPPTGTVSATRIVENWKPQKGSYGIVLAPESHPYKCSNIQSGVGRPETWTNIWISDPLESLPAWVQYTFNTTQEINTLHLTFDTNLNLAHMSVPGLYRAPECVRDYRILYRDEDKIDTWNEIVSVTDNYQRKRIHRFKTLRTNAVKVEVIATNGDPSARLYELRAYRE